MLTLYSIAVLDELKFNLDPLSSESSELDGTAGFHHHSLYLFLRDYARVPDQQ